MVVPSALFASRGQATSCAGAGGLGGGGGGGVCAQALAQKSRARKSFIRRVCKVAPEGEMGPKSNPSLPEADGDADDLVAVAGGGAVVRYIDARGAELRRLFAQAQADLFGRRGRIHRDIEEYLAQSIVPLFRLA